MEETPESFGAAKEGSQSSVRSQYMLYGVVCSVVLRCVVQYIYTVASK